MRPHAALFILLLSATFSSGTASPTTAPRPGIILEVINRHFTVGLKIPSIYLRVFSDGVAECHTMKYSEEDRVVVKKKTLTHEELEEVKALVEDPELARVAKRYELMEMVIDSWMEWTIRVPRANNTQSIQVLDFSPESARKKKTPYPDSLARLGCTIWKVRMEVFGDKPYGRFEDCKDILAIQ